VGQFVRRHQVALWIVAGIALAVALRVPWLDAPLNRDEGGDALIAQNWSHGGPFAYGHVFLDRPPLLLALYRLAGDAGGIRILGAIAAALLVVTTTLLAVRLAGRRAAPYAAIICALLVSSFALRAVLTPAELLAAVPASAAVLLVVIAFEDHRSRPQRSS
jgi:4-amino-4-deoxy-L-arabinose transferase-like glycosyltransferase